MTDRWYDLNSESAKEYSKNYYQAHKEQQMASARAAYARRRRLVLEHYSNGEPACACCGETIFEFLVLDHIDNNGSEHKRSNDGPPRSGNHTYLWVIKHDFPEGFQVLCNNCNCAKSYLGECPHQKGTRR